PACEAETPMPRCGMRLFGFCVLLIVFSAANMRGQSAENSPSPNDAVAKRLDEINTKLDALSQQMLKMEQQLSKPGVMVGEPTPVATASETSHTSNGTTHVVARGETLTSIAKQYKVTVDDLQKFNRIEDGRKLQAGQTVMIPPPGA